MKTSILQHLLEPARRIRSRIPCYSALGSRSVIAGLLILALNWSLVLPFSTHAEPHATKAKPTAPSSPASSSPTQATETFNVYGPQRFTRLIGQPVNVVQSFSLPADAIAPFNIMVENGTPEGSNRVSSATIKLNGANLFTPSDFNQNVSSLTKSVTLTATNTLEVKLTSAAGSYLTITLTATRVASQPSLVSVTPARTTQGQTLSVTLQGNNTHWVAGQTRLSLGGEIAVGGAGYGEAGPVTVVNSTNATATVVVSPTAALEPRLAQVSTPIAGSTFETVSLPAAFTVDAAVAPGAVTANVTTIAGNAGTSGYSDGNGSNARFQKLSSVTVGPDDAIYVADPGNQRIRVVRASSGPPPTVWTVSTLAGNGTAGFADGAGASAMFNNPQGVAVDASGVVYVADTANNRIRRIAADGTVSTLAGDGTAGLQNGAGSQARFNAPQGVALDNQGNVYVADTGNSAVRKIDGAGTVYTLAGDGSVGSNDSPGARFDGLVGITVEGQNVYIYLADTGNHRIRRLDVAGTVITVTGAERGFKDGAAAQARFAEPSGIAIDSDSKIIVADAANSLIRSVDLNLATSGSNQAVTTLAGTGIRGATDGSGDVARFFMPRGLAISNSSAIIVADTGNHVLRRVLLPPIIHAINPSSARRGDTIQIQGARFDGRGLERNVVRFAKSGGGTTFGSVTQATQTVVAVIVPTDAVTGPVTVETEGGTATAPTDFVVNQFPAPVITDFTPKRGTPGTQVTLTGSNLKVDANDPAVTFAGNGGTRVPALVSSASATEVRVTVPNGAFTGLIELSHVGGTATTATAFTVDTEQDFVLTIAPSTTTAVQGGAATYVVYVTSTQSTFSQLASLTASGLPAGITATFGPAQITAGASSTLTLQLSGTIAPGSYPFTIHGVASVSGNDLERTAGATLNVMAGGQTTLSGRVLSTDSEPIIGATASLDGKTAMTDAAGSFLLSGITAGTNRPLMIDGRTANSPNKTYPIIIEPANIVAGQANVNAYTFYLPPIDTQYEVEVVPGQNTVANNPRVPGLQMTIPAGANLRNRDGSPVTRVSITPLAIDRTPAPLPAGIKTGLVYTSQPGGALTDVPIPVIYPNLLGTNPGTRVNLYAFNHDTVQWYVYGTGTVSSDGRTIAPDINPSTGQHYGLPDFSWHFPSAAGPGGNPGEPDDCPKNRGSSPVDFSTGVKIEKATDVSFGGSRGGLLLSRTYTSDLGRGRVTGAFGVGWKDNYDFRLTGSFVIGGAGRVVTPEQQTGQLFSYAQTDSSGALVFTTTASISQLGDVLRKLTDGTFEYRLASGNVMRFDASGRVTAIADANGNTTTLAYTGANLTRVTDAVGRSLNFDYDPSGRRIRMTDPLGRQWQYSYDPLSRLATVTDPLSGVMRYDYDTLNQLTKVTDKRGNVIKQLTYDANGRVTDQKFADGGIEHYDYTLAGGIISSTTITNTLGYQRTLRFNAVGYVTEAIDRLGQRSQINRDLTTNTALSTTGPCGCAENTRQYDARGNITTTTDRLGQQTKMEYEPVFNRLTKITDPLGRTLSFTYDTRGNLLTMTDALNQTTTISYDSFGQLISVTDPLGHTQRTEYDAYGNISAVIDALNNRMTMEHDLVGRVTARTDALGRRSTNEYDGLNQVVSTTDPSGAVTRYFYDANSNLVKVTDALTHSWTGFYDAKDRVVSTTDAVGRVTRTLYDKADEVTASISPSGRTLRNIYDPRGQLMTMTDPLGNVVTYQTDSRGNLISITDQRGQVTTFIYDELGRSIGMRDSLGRLSSQSYDAADNVSETIDRLGRRVNFSYDAGNRPTRITYADAVVTYTYDAASRVTRIYDTQSGAVDWSYDDANRLLSETTPNGTVSYSYNEASQLTSMRAADRPPATYAYDTAGRLQTIAQGAETFTYSYDVLSRPATLQRPNGVQTSYSFDEVDRLARLTHTNSFNQPIEDYQFAYNIDDEIESITSLASATQLPQAKTVAVADAANRIAQFGEASYAFDERGMTTSKTDAQGTTTYQWDARGRLTQSTLPSGQTINYGYDATGRLASRATNGSSTSFLYNDLDVVLDRGSDGSQVDYLNGMALDDKLRQSSNATGALYFLQDQLRSTVALTDAGGNVVERKQYEPFGESQPSAFTRYTFTGRERDASTGLMYYRARWYDPKQGRFISEDPAGFAGGLNKYAYVGNNPVTKTDPIGLYEIDVHYYLTYYLAKKTGCFSDPEAQDIANEDQRTDEDASTKPGRGNTDQQRMQNRVFHALHPGAAEGVGSPLLWQGAMNEKSGHKWIGRYMHYLQDTFSHAGYTSDVWGHASGTHSVDKTASDPAKAQRMVAATWQALIQYAKAKHCNCDPKWDDSMWPTLNDFINVATDNPEGSTIDATERAWDNPGLGDPVALARKRRILGLNDRYTGQW